MLKHDQHVPYGQLAAERGIWHRAAAGRWGLQRRAWPSSQIITRCRSWASSFIRLNRWLKGFGLVEWIMIVKNIIREVQILPGIKMIHHFQRWSKYGSIESMTITSATHDKWNLSPLSIEKIISLPILSITGEHTKPTRSPCKFNLFIPIRVNVIDNPLNSIFLHLSGVFFRYMSRIKTYSYFWKIIK